MEKMQASFRTGDDVETIKKPTNTGETKHYVSITDINFALSTFLCPSPEQTFVSFYVFQTTMGRPDHYCRSFSGRAATFGPLFSLSRRRRDRRREAKTFCVILASRRWPGVIMTSLAFPYKVYEKESFLASSSSPFCPPHSWRRRGDINADEEKTHSRIPPSPLKNSRRKKNRGKNECHIVRFNIANMCPPVAAGAPAGVAAEAGAVVGAA